MMLVYDYMIPVTYCNWGLKDFKWGEMGATPWAVISMKNSVKNQYFCNSGINLNNWKLHRVKINENNKLNNFTTGYSGSPETLDSMHVSSYLVKQLSNNLRNNFFQPLYYVPRQQLHSALE